MDIKEKIKNIKWNRMNIFEKTVCHFYNRYTIEQRGNMIVYKLENNDMMFDITEETNKRLIISYYSLYRDLIRTNLIEKNIVQNETNKYIHKYFGFNDYTINDVIL